MAINVKLTSAIHAEGIKVLVYGQAGAGKTTLIPSLPDCFILSAEGGLLSIAGSDTAYVEIKTVADIEEVYLWLTQSEESKGFESIAIDSISEIAEVVLSTEKKNNKDPRAAYGEMQTQLADIIRAFRDIPNKNILMTAKLEKSQDEMGRILYAPTMPGNKLGQSLPYFFDEVFALRVEKNSEGVTQRGLMCQSDGLWQAKDRSGKLEMWENPDLGAVINKIKGLKNG